MIERADLIRQAEAALEGTTDGPWVLDAEGADLKIMAGDEVLMCDTTYYPGVPNNEADWRFIAWCRTGVPALIDALKGGA